MNARILVVDDNPSIHEDFRKVLASPLSEDQDFSNIRAIFLGGSENLPIHPVFQVDYASQGQEAVDIFEAARKNGFSHPVAFVDVHMPPGINGIETATRLWAIHPDLQIVICSAYTDYTWEQIAEKLGHRDQLVILKKPFDSIEVLQLACALTEKWKIGRETSARIREIELEVAARTSALIAANLKLEAEIEHRKIVEDQLLRTQRLDSLGMLASGIAHDLNNLLSPIMMSTQMLAEDSLRPQQQMLLNTIQTATERAAQILAQMLTFARGTADDRTSLEAGALLEEVARIIGKAFPVAIEIRCQPALELPLLCGNPTQLHQVLMNLCVNARDAMPLGGKLTLEADFFIVDESYASNYKGAQPGDYVRLQVSDTGTGIPDEIRGKILDPFFTTKEPGKGTGLGLSTAVGIVHSHGGFVEIRSFVGQGTTFLIHLPVATDNAPAPTEAAENVPRQGNGELILVVDDESTIRDVTAATLVRNGYQAITAGDGVEAILAYTQEKRKIHAVITDINMPILDGTGFVNALKHISRDIRVILTSGSLESARMQNLNALGISGILPKPFHSRQLLSLLHETLLQGR